MNSPFHSWEWRNGHWYHLRVEGKENVPIKGNLQAATVSSIMAYATMSQFTAKDVPVAISDGRGVLKQISLINCQTNKCRPGGYIWRINRTSSASFQIVIICINGEFCLLEMNAPEFDVKLKSRLSATVSMRRAISHNLISVNDVGVLTRVEVSDGSLCIHKNGELACRVSDTQVFTWIRDFSCVSNDVGILLAGDPNGKRNILSLDLNSGGIIAVRRCDTLHPIGVSAGLVIFRDGRDILISNTMLESPQIIGNLCVADSRVGDFPNSSDFAFASSDDGRFVGACIQTESKLPVWITYDLRMYSVFRSSFPTYRILF